MFDCPVTGGASNYGNDRQSESAIEEIRECPEHPQFLVGVRRRVALFAQFDVLEVPALAFLVAQFFESVAEQAGL